MDDRTTRPGDLGMRTRNDDPPVKITREIPLPWLAGVLFTLIFNGISVWLGQQSQAKALDGLTTEVRELRAAAAQGGLKTVEHDLKLVDHERRIQVLETRKP